MQKQQGTKNCISLLLSFGLQKKMQICRLTRNFLQHQNDMFVYPSMEMVEFLQEQAELVGSHFTKVSDRMTKIKPVLEETKIKDASALLGGKRTFIPVADEMRHLVGLFTEKSVVKAVNGGYLNKKISAVSVLEKAEDFIAPDVICDEIPKGVYMVTADGTAKGIYKGVLVI